jgi:hypothetical protein
MERVRERGREREKACFYLFRRFVSIPEKPTASISTLRKEKESDEKCKYAQTNSS